MNLSEQIKNVDLVALAESQGVELRRRGNAWVGKCPLHDENNPSFYIRGGRFKCFGCGEYGDAVDLIQGIYGCNFPEALRRLGIETGQITLKDRIEIKRQRRLKARRIQRERDLIFTLGILIRAAHNCSEFIHLLPAWEHYHDILSRGTREQKDKVIEGLKDMATIRRNYLFRPDFNYRKWLFNFKHNEKGVSDHNKGAGNEGEKRNARN